jgi:hypothetical protein
VHFFKSYYDYYYYLLKPASFSCVYEVIVSFDKEPEKWNDLGLEFVLGDIQN